MSENVVDASVLFGGPPATRGHIHGWKDNGYGLWECKCGETTKGIPAPARSARPVTVTLEPRHVRALERLSSGGNADAEEALSEIGYAFTSVGGKLP